MAKERGKSDILKSLEKEKQKDPTVGDDLFDGNRFAVERHQKYWEAVALEGDYGFYTRIADKLAKCLEDIKEVRLELPGSAGSTNVTYNHGSTTMLAIDMEMKVDRQLQYLGDRLDETERIARYTAETFQDTVDCVTYLESNRTS